MKSSNTTTQRKKILDHLLGGQVLTEDTGGLLFGVRRNAARISELRKAGWRIRTTLDESRCAIWSIDPRNPRKEGGDRG